MSDAIAQIKTAGGVIQLGKDKGQKAEDRNEKGPVYPGLILLCHRLTFRLYVFTFVPSHR